MEHQGPERLDDNGQIFTKIVERIILQTRAYFLCFSPIPDFTPPRDFFLSLLPSWHKY